MSDPALTYRLFNNKEFSEAACAKNFRSERPGVPLAESPTDQGRQVQLEGARIIEYDVK